MTADVEFEIPLEYVYLPPETDEGADRLVVVLHGRGADETDLIPIARRLPAAHVVSLRAPDPLMGGYTWYELDLSGGGLHQSQPDADDFRRSLDLIRTSVDSLRDGLDAETVGMLGFSQGAITSLALLAEEPDAYAWVVSLHGYLAASHVERGGTLDGTPVFVSAGQGDDIIPASRAESAADSLREMGADVTFETYPVGHSIAPDELEDLVSFVAARGE